MTMVQDARPAIDADLVRGSNGSLTERGKTRSSLASKTARLPTCLAVIKRDALGLLAVGIPAPRRVFVRDERSRKQRGSSD